MKLELLLAAALTTTGSFVWAQEKPQSPTGKKFTTCQWPNPCGATGSITLPKPQEDKTPAPVPNLPQPIKSSTLSSTDPLHAQIVEGRILDAQNGGVVSAMRTKDGVIYQGEPLRDAVRDLSLPSSTIPAKKNDSVSEPAEKDWNTVSMKSASAEQINGMRSERKALREGSSESRTAANTRMWGK